MEFQPDMLYQLLQTDLCLDEPLPLTSDLSVTDARKSALLASIFKKWEPENTDSLAQTAIASFVSCNDSCASYRLEATGFQRQAIDLARDKIHQLFQSGRDQFDLFSLHDVCAVGKCGPGLSAGVKRTDFLGKMFESTLTTTDYGLYNFYVSQLSPRWRDAEKLRNKIHGVELRRGSQLATVRKNRETDRTIGKECSLDMFFQLGAGLCLEQLLLIGHNIDLSTQPNINKAMARQGSVSGELSTIDLRNASNTISTTLVRYLLPPRLFSILDLCRSKEIEIKGEWVPLSLFSSMGNGFTFPLQTLIFATLVQASYEVLGIIPRSKGLDRNYAVFGDDIICTKNAYNFVCQVLHACGFHVNDEKSFNVGLFRESCGGDYFKGFDIRAVYLRRNLGHEDLYSAFNRLARWSAKYGIDLSDVLRYLKGLVVFRPVPFDEQDTAGLKIPSAQLTACKRDSNGAKYYTAWVSRNRTLRVGAIGRPVSIPSVEHQDLLMNYNGAVICAIGGYVRNYQIGVRDSHPKWQVRRKKTPSWDWIPTPGVTLRDYEDALVGVL